MFMEKYIFIEHFNVCRLRSKSEGLVFLSCLRLFSISVSCNDKWTSPPYPHAFEGESWEVGRQVKKKMWRNWKLILNSFQCSKHLLHCY